MAKNKKLSFKESVICQLNSRFCKEVNVSFSQMCNGTIQSCGSQKAINRFDNDSEEVFATEWFNDFSYYIRIRFVRCGKQEKAFSSVSFFQKFENVPKQLFRAEWDNYSSEDIVECHPQPHWHFTAPLSDKSSFEELEENSIEHQLLEENEISNSKNINLDRMHFAMAGGWISDGNMFCPQEDENSLINWLIHLFNYVKKELTYKESRQQHR